MKYGLCFAQDTRIEGSDLAISELFVSWFPLLFGLFFIVTFIVDEVRSRGHLKLGREPKKGEIIGLLVLLGFNLIVALPVITIGLVVEYALGAPPFLELLLVAVMALTDLIPIFLSGILSYFFVKGVYERWGLSIGVFFVTSILSLLVLIDSVGLLQPGLPFIIEMVSTLVIVQFEFLIMMVLFAVCLNRCGSSSRLSEGKDQTSEQRVGNLSTESALRLIVGFGKRITNDADAEAQEALQTIYESHSHCKKVLNQAGREVNIDLGSIITRNDIAYSQQALEFTNGQFGKLEKWTRNVMGLFMVISIASAILSVILVSMRIYVGLFFLMPTIILPLITLFWYQQSARYETGRFGALGMIQFNSYLLTNDEFRKRVIRERAVFGLSLLILFIIMASSLIGTYDSGLVWIPVAATILIVGGVLSTKDRMLSSKRLDIPVVIERGLKFIGIDDLEELGEEPIPIDPIPASHMKEEVKHEVSLDWHQQLEVRGHGDFAKKVVGKSREVYTEHAATMIFMGVGGIMLLMGVLTYFMFSTFSILNSMVIIAIGFIIVGSPLFVYGSYTYLKMRNITRFHRLTRKNLTLLISYFDQEAQGISDFGSMTETHAPSEYLNYGIVSMLMHTFVRASIVRLQHRIPWSKELVEKVWKTRSSYPKYEGVGVLVTSVFFVIVYQWFSSFQSEYFPDILKLVFLGLIFFIVLSMAYSFIFYYIEKRALVEIMEVMHGLEDVTPLDTLTALIDLIGSQFPMPIRVLLVGNYPNVSYTGRVYFTTTGIELREAVIIPHGMAIDVS